MVLSEEGRMNLKNNAMIGFNSPKEFFEFYTSLGILHEWKIVTGKMNDRGERIENRGYVHTLRKLFKEKKLFRRMVSIAEIVSFLDEYHLLKRILVTLKKKLDPEQYTSLKIFLEYKIPYSKNRRIDIIFQYGKKLLLFEFRVSATFPNQSAMWKKKELELMIYKEFMMNYLPKDYQLYLYAFIGMPEYHHNQKIEKHIMYNKTNIDFFVDYMMTYLFDQLQRPEEFNLLKD